MPNIPETEFEWDERKRETTLEKHDIDFLDATRVFDGRPAVHADQIIRMKNVGLPPAN